MAAYGALVSLMNTIHQIMNHPQVSTFFDNKQIKHLLEETISLLNFVEANNYGGGNKEAGALEREIASAAQAAEDVIDSHIMDQINAETSLRHSLDLQQTTQDMDVVLKKANEFKWIPGSGEEQRTSVVEIGETAMVGLHAELDELLYQLTSDPSSGLQTISIVGMGGTGKTTLAKSIFEHPLIKEYFEFRGWATISQQHNAQKVLAQLLSSLGKSSSEAVNALGQELYQKLFSRRYLIILDDIWSVKAWDEVRCFIPKNNNGSRVVLTTRSSKVANDCCSSPFTMRFLNEAESWNLFCAKAFKNESCPPKQREVVEKLNEKALKNESCPPHLQKVGAEIVKLCKGLALSIVVMGGLLSQSPRTVEYWEGVVKDIKSISGESLDVLYLSYTHLPPHLKPCFLYMGVFEEDSEIRVSEVVKLLVAEGFVKPNESQDLEETVEGYLQDLVDRNLILTGRRRKNGKIGYCGIHDLLRELSIKLSKERGTFHVTDPDDIRGTERHLICWSLDCTKDCTPLTRCIMTRYLKGNPVKQGLLRVLNTEDSVDSPEELYGNVNLRYLAYKQPYVLRKISSSASLMWNLQSLVIQGDAFSPVVVAPPEIWKMRQLRHVECNTIYLPPCDDSLILENLRTLKTALNLRLSGEARKIIPKIKKLYLRYRRELQGYDDCLFEYLSTIGGMDKLESLHLSIWSFSGYKPNKKLAFPSSLKKLFLSGCKLDCDYLQIIGSLPLLEVLILDDYSISFGDEWTPIDGQFRRLKFLKFTCSFDYWVVEHSHFPALEKLHIKVYSPIFEIPLEIGDISTLELLRVDVSSSVSAAISALKIKEAQLELENDSLQIEVSIHQLELEDFKRRAALEGLSISNIQFEIR